MIDAFHRADWPARQELAGRFSDFRLRMLARRLVYCEAPQVIPPQQRAASEAAIARRLCGDGDTAGSWTRLERAIADCLTLRNRAEENQRLFFQEHLDHLTAWRDRLAQLVPQSPGEDLAAELVLSGP